LSRNLLRKWFNLGW